MESANQEAATTPPFSSSERRRGRGSVGTAAGRHKSVCKRNSEARPLLPRNFGVKKIKSKTHKRKSTEGTSKVELRARHIHVETTPILHFPAPGFSRMFPEGGSSRNGKFRKACFLLASASKNVKYASQQVAITPLLARSESKKGKKAGYGNAGTAAGQLKFF